MSTKGFLIVPNALLAFAAQSPETLTPEGLATLYSVWHEAVTLEGEHPELTGFRVVVGPGGRQTYTRTRTFRPAGRRDVRLRPPQRRAREQGVVTLTARSDTATARAHPRPT